MPCVNLKTDAFTLKIHNLDTLHQIHNQKEKFKTVTMMLLYFGLFWRWATCTIVSAPSDPFTPTLKFAVYLDYIYK